jgi:hypothetical protein
MGFLLKLLGGSALDTVDKLLSGRFFPNKEKAQDNAAIQDSKVLEQYAADQFASSREQDCLGLFRRRLKPDRKTIRILPNSVGVCMAHMEPGELSGINGSI